MATMLNSKINNPNRWDEDLHSMKVMGVDKMWFEEFPDHTMLLAKARGEYFREKIVDDGPLAAAGRLSLNISRHFCHGKRYRAFRTKLRNIRARKA